MINQIKWVLVILVLITMAVLLSYFVSTNSTEIQLKLVVPLLGIAHQTNPMSVAWVVISSFVLGFLISATVMLLQLIRNWFQIRRLQRENSALQKLIDRHESVSDESNQASA